MIYYFLAAPPSASFASAQLETSKFEAAAANVTRPFKAALPNHKIEWENHCTPTLTPSPFSHRCFDVWITCSFILIALFKPLQLILFCLFVYYYYLSLYLVLLVILLVLNHSCFVWSDVRLMFIQSLSLVFDYSITLARRTLDLLVDRGKKRQNRIGSILWWASQLNFCVLPCLSNCLYSFNLQLANFFYFYFHFKKCCVKVYQPLFLCVVD